MKKKTPPGDTDISGFLERLLDTPQNTVPTSLFGRLGRLASTMAGTAASAGLRRLAGGEALDAKLAEKLALSLGQLKGLAMKGGQILSYTDDSLPPEVRRVL